MHELHNFITLCTCARGRAIGFVCHLSTQKSPNLDILESEQSVSTTKQSKSVKNLLVSASNHTARLTSATNHAFCWPCLSTTPTYSCLYAFCPCAENWSGIVGKGHQRKHATDTGIQVSNTMQHKPTGYVLWRALVWDCNVIDQSIRGVYVTDIYREWHAPFPLSVCMYKWYRPLVAAVVFL